MTEPEPNHDTIERIETPESVEDRYRALNDAVASSTAATITVAGLTIDRADFEGIGGFHEGILAGGEYDLAMRLRALGRELALPARPDGAASRWIGRRYPAAWRRASPVELWSVVAADNRVLPGREPPPPVTEAERSVVVFTDAYPARSETFVFNEVATLSELGWSVRVESSARPARVERSAARAGRVDYLEDDPPLGALRDLLRIAVRHPLACLADIRARRRWGVEERPWPLRSLASAARRLEAGGERHIHVHFAGGACLNAMRIARITGIPYSVIGHGYDVFAEPRNLAEKLIGASFVVAPCEYTATHLRRLLPAARAGDVHVVVMGVDGERFRRRRPYPGNGHVVAIGRLVEKKGFGYLIEAAARLATRPASLERLTIAGDGPLRRELGGAIANSAIEGTARIVDAWGVDAIRELLEGADLLAMPAVIAADGDRDAMPVVVKEALAMEVPVVATATAGLPELVGPAWGRLVSARDPDALADAIEWLLSLSVERRAEIGRAGRRHVLAHCDVRTETAKLAALIAASR